MVRPMANLMTGAVPSIIETIGNTPIVKLNAVAADVESEIYVKIEYLNPAGSMKDRVGLNIIRDALPDRVYLGDFPDLLRERGIAPPRPATLKRSLQELRRKLADDPVLRNLRTQISS